MRVSTSLLFGALLCIASAQASTTTYTSSSAFFSALGSVQVEDYSSGFSNGQDIASGTTIHGITYSNFVLGNGATNLDITNQYNSFSGLSLGADHTSLGSSLTFFFGQEGATVSFGTPVFALGIFFNVNLNSGNYGFTTSDGTATSGSAAWDTHTFVFAGLISTTPFSSASFSSSDVAGSYNIPEIVTSTPEPATFFVGAAGLVLLAAVRRRRTTPSN